MCLTSTRVVSREFGILKVIQQPSYGFLPTAQFIWPPTYDPFYCFPFYGPNSLALFLCPTSYGLLRVSKSCNHAITRLRKIFDFCAYLGLRNANQEKLAQMFYIYHNFTIFSTFTCFYVIFYAGFCAKLSISAF